MITGSLILPSASAQSTNPNYVKAKKGDVVTFQEAVVTNLPAYRLETKKILLLEKLVTGQQKEITSLQREVAADSVIIAREKQRADYVEGLYQEERAYTDTLAKQLETAFKIEQRQQRFYNKKELWFLLGAGIGILLAK
jgi:hypothetical protein